MFLTLQVAIIFICFSLSEQPLGPRGNSLSCWMLGNTRHQTCQGIFHLGCDDEVFSFSVCASHSHLAVCASRRWYRWSSTWRSAGQSTPAVDDNTLRVCLAWLSYLHSDERMSHISATYCHPIMTHWLGGGQNIYSLSVTLSVTEDWKQKWIQQQGCRGNLQALKYTLVVILWLEYTHITLLSHISHIVNYILKPNMSLFASFGRKLMLLPCFEKLYSVVFHFWQKQAISGICYAINTSHRHTFESVRQ